MGIATLLVAGAGYWAWHARGTAQAVQAARPALPDLRNWPEELRQRFTKANRDSVDALAELSRLYHANGFLTEAARCYAALERLQPAEPRWLHRNATILAGYGDTESAIARWQRVAKLSPDYLPARLRLGEAFAKIERPADAAQVYAEVLQRKPGEPYAQLGLARLDQEAQRWEDARRRLEAVAAQTGQELGADLLVTVYEQLGQREAARALRAKAKAAGSFRDPPDPWIDELMDDCFDAYRLSVAAGTRHQGGDRAGTMRLLERAVTLAPNDVTVRFQLAGVQAEGGDLAAARTQLERCTTLAPNFPDAWAHLSALLERGGDRRGAEQVLLAGLRHCPESPGLHLMRARHLREAGRVAEAIAEFRASIRFRPNEADAYLELATTLFRLERVAEGLAELDRALAAEPDHPTALALRTFHAISDGKEADARKWLGAVLNQPRVPKQQVERLLAGFREQFGREY